MECRKVIWSREVCGCFGVWATNSRMYTGWGVLYVNYYDPEFYRWEISSGKRRPTHLQFRYPWRVQVGTL